MRVFNGVMMFETSTSFREVSVDLLRRAVGLPLPPSPTSPGGAGHSLRWIVTQFRVYDREWRDTATTTSSR